VGRPRDSSLVARKIGSGRRIVCASPAYLRKAGTLQLPADLVNHNCLTFRAHPGSNVWSFKARKGTSNIRVSGSLFADDGEALVAAAVAGAGLILMPAWLVGMYIREGQLREVLPKFQVAPKDTPLYALYPHQRHLPPKVRAFIGRWYGMAVLARISHRVSSRGRGDGRRYKARERKCAEA
jgi:DNA-binding transcriptional LysR family regulator